MDAANHMEMSQILKSKLTFRYNFFKCGIKRQYRELQRIYQYAYIIEHTFTYNNRNV